jgi:hypothetical protein
MSGNVVSRTSKMQSDVTEAVRFMVNVHSSPSPVTIEGLDGPAFEGFTAFTTRSREEGRDRYRVHLGYFPSLEAANSILALIRRRYPAAWVVPCPAPVHQGGPAIHEPAQLPTAPLLIAAPIDLYPELTLALDLVVASKVTPAPASDPERRAPVAAAQVLDEPFKLFDAPFYKLELMPDPPLASVPAALVRPKAPVAAAAPAREGGLDFIETITLSDSQVLRVLEEGAPVRGEVMSEYAVQVMWSVSPIDIRLVPKSPMFTEYTLYPFQGVHRGHRGFGLRLGFFKELYAAEQVSTFLRPDYEQSLVVKVSDKERLGATPALPVAGARKPARLLAGKVPTAPPVCPAAPEASTRILASLGGAPSNRVKADEEPKSWFKGLVRRLG